MRYETPCGHPSAEVHHGWFEQTTLSSRSIMPTILIRQVQRWGPMVWIPCHEERWVCGVGMPQTFFSWDLPILWFNPADSGWHSKPCESSWPQVGDACARAWWQDAAEQQAQHSRMSEGCRVLSNLIVSLDHILTMMLGKCLKMRAILAGTRTSCDGWKVFALVKKQCRVAWPVYFANAHHTCGCSEFSMSGICVGDSNCRECLVEWKFRHAAQRTVIACGLVSYYNDDERS